MKRFHSRALLISLAGTALLLCAQPAAAQNGYEQNNDGQNGTPPHAQANSMNGDYEYNGTANWAGPYVGAHVGDAISEFTNEGSRPGPGGTDDNFTTGVQAGYNWQHGHMVYGFEGDGSWLPVDNHFAGGSYDQNWLSTLRARAGYAMGRFLPYVTAGLAFTGTQTNAGAGGSEGSVHTGLALGGGVEYMYNDRWSMDGQYLYADAPNEHTTIGGTTYAGGANHVLTVGVNYHFE
ncbi:MAG TPA: outer membrane protein [Alphaproteobacteria bacterium]|nr:outer membrane protein [Alphaproteobacteria bacterium]